MTYEFIFGFLCGVSLSGGLLVAFLVRARWNSRSKAIEPIPVMTAEEATVTPDETQRLETKDLYALLAHAQPAKSAARTITPNRKVPAIRQPVAAHPPAPESTHPVEEDEILLDFTGL